jgi:hypothetical protein
MLHTTWYNPRAGLVGPGPCYLLRYPESGGLFLQIYFPQTVNFSADWAQAEG